MNFIEFDTDLMPSLSDAVLEPDNGEDKGFAILEFLAAAESGDPNIIIIDNNDLESDNIKDLLDKGICRIIGGGVTTKSIPALMYGLQHTTRIMYKHTIQEMSRKFTTDDEFIKATFNNITSEEKNN
jgi:hypothetical protein